MGLLVFRILDVAPIESLREEEMRKVSLYLLGVLVFTALCAASAGAVQYQIQDLGIGTAYDVNNSGQVVGDAFLWDSASGRRDLATFGGTNSVARSINDSGTAVGMATDYAGHGYSAAWTNGQITKLCLQNGMAWDGDAWGVNNAGHVCGASLGRAVLLRDGTATTVCRSPDGDCYAYALNDSDDVVGYQPYPNSHVHAFLVKGGVDFEDIGAIDTFFHPATKAYDINNKGWVVGFIWNQDPLGIQQGIVWTDQGWFRLNGFGSSNCAYGINNEQQIVGDAFTSAREWHAFLWDSTNGIVDLGVLPGTHDSRAYAINDNGWIVGESGGRAVLWQPIPEPSTLLALLSGLAGIGAMAFRRRGS